jgi:hypothetical protein
VVAFRNLGEEKPEEELMGEGYWISNNLQLFFEWFPIYILDECDEKYTDILKFIKKKLLIAPPFTS